MRALDYADRCLDLLGGFAITTLAFYGLFLSVDGTIKTGTSQVGLFLLGLSLCFVFILFIIMPGIGMWREGSNE